MQLQTRSQESFGTPTALRCSVELMRVYSDPLAGLDRVEPQLSGLAAHLPKIAGTSNKQLLPYNARLETPCRLWLPWYMAQFPASVLRP